MFSESNSSTFSRRWVSVSLDVGTMDVVVSGGVETTIVAVEKLRIVGRIIEYLKILVGVRGYF